MDSFCTFLGPINRKTTARNTKYSTQFNPAHPFILSHCRFGSLYVPPAPIPRSRLRYFRSCRALPQKCRQDYSADNGGQRIRSTSIKRTDEWPHPLHPKNEIHDLKHTNSNTSLVTGHTRPMSGFDYRTLASDVLSNL